MWPSTRFKPEGEPLLEGEIEGVRWKFFGAIDADGVRAWIERETAAGSQSGGGWGGGLLPFNTHSGVQLGHIGSIGSSGVPSEPNPDYGHVAMVDGAVSKEIATVVVELEDASSIAAEIVDVGHPEANLFFAAWPARYPWRRLSARDASGRELDAKVRGELFGPGPGGR